MQKRDILEYQLRQLAEVIASVAQLKSAGSYDMALETIHQALQQIPALDWHRDPQWDGFFQSLIAHYGTDYLVLQAMAELLMEKAEIHSLFHEHHRSKPILTVSHQILEYIQQHSDTFSFERMHLLMLLEDILELPGKRA